MREDAPPRQVLAERLHDLLVVAVARPGAADSRRSPSSVDAGLSADVARACEHRADQDRRADGRPRHWRSAAAASGLVSRVDVRRVLRPDHELRLRRPPGPHVVGQPHGLADVVVEHRAALGVEVQPEPGHVALDRGHVDRSGRRRRRCRTGAPPARSRAVPSSTAAMQTPGSTTRGSAAASASAGLPCPTSRRPPMPARSAPKPSSATANDSSGTPPSCASGSNGPSVWPKATTPQGNPPNGTLRFQPLLGRPQRREPDRPAGQPPHHDGGEAEQRREHRLRRRTAPATARRRRAHRPRHQRDVERQPEQEAVPEAAEQARRLPQQHPCQHRERERPPVPPAERREAHAHQQTGDDRGCSRGSSGQRPPTPQPDTGAPPASAGLSHG